MEAIEFSNALQVPQAVQQMESPFLVVCGKDHGSVDWTRMRDEIGESRWRSYIRMRALVRAAGRAA